MDSTDLDVVVLLLSKLSLESLQLFAQLLLGPLRHLFSKRAVLGDTQAFGSECVDTCSVLVALALQRLVTLVQDCVGVVRLDDVRFEIGDALQDAIDVDRKRFRRHRALVDVDAANFDRRFVRRRIDQLVDVAQRFDCPRVGARQALLTFYQRRFVRFDIEHGQHVGAIERVDRCVGGIRLCLHCQLRVRAATE